MKELGGGEGTGKVPRRKKCCSLEMGHVAKPKSCCPARNAKLSYTTQARDALSAGPLSSLHAWVSKAFVVCEAEEVSDTKHTSGGGPSWVSTLQSHRAPQRKGRSWGCCSASRDRLGGDKGVKNPGKKLQMDFTDGPLATTANLHRLHAQVVRVPGHQHYTAGAGARGAGWFSGTPIPLAPPGDGVGQRLGCSSVVLVSAGGMEKKKRR